MKNKYIIEIAVKSLIRSKVVAITEIICLTLGMVIPFFFIAQFNNGYYEAKKNAGAFITENIIMLNPDYGGDALPIVRNDFSTIAQVDGVDGIYYENVMQRENVFIHNSLVIGYKLCLVDENFNDILSSGWLSDGKTIVKENECIIGKKLAKKENVTIGDTLRINDNEYIVSGINQIPNYEKSIMISDTSKVKFDLYDATYFIKTDGNIKDIGSDLENHVISHYGTYDFYYETEINNLFYNKLSSGWGPTIVISLLSLLYSLVNIYNIMRFYTIKFRRKIAISLAFGSTKGQIYLQKYIEVAIVSLMGSFLTYFTLYCIEKSPIQYILSIRLDIYILIVMLILGQVVALVFSTLLVQYLLEKPIAEVIKG